MRRMILMAVTASLSLAACSQATPSAVRDPGARLRDAVTATLELDSFRVVTSDGDRVTDYISPDRLRVSSFGSELIVVGDVLYISHPDRSGYFFRESDPERSNVSGFLAVFEVLLEAEDVRSDGDAIDFTFPAVPSVAPGGTGRAFISDGLLARLELSYENQQRSSAASITSINSVPAIDPPSADRVAPFESGLPPCEQGGMPPPGEIICERADTASR